MKRLKLVLLGLVSGTALLVSANANAGGDLAPERPFSWTGFYLGIHAGVATGDVDAFFSVAKASPWDHDRSGMIGDGQVGYNWQTGNIVLGVEADASITPCSLVCSSASACAGSQSVVRGDASGDKERAQEKESSAGDG